MLLTSENAVKFDLIIDYLVTKNSLVSETSVNDQTFDRPAAIFSTKVLCVVRYLRIFGSRVPDPGQWVL